MNENKQLASAPQAQKASALAVMAGRMNVEPEKLLQTLKETVFKGASHSELLALVVVANEYGLNPLLKEIYAFPAKGGGIVPVVSVDGWTKIINQHPAMDGLDFEWEHGEGGKLVACTAVLYRKDRSRPVRVTEYLAECRRNTEPWKMEHRMLRHKALIQGGRLAFGFSGIFDEDEGERIKAAEASVVASRPIFDRPAEAGRSAEKERAPRKPKDQGVAAAEVPTNEAVITELEAPAEELPFAPDSPQKRLMQALDDADIGEGWFMTRVGKRGRLVASLSEAEAEDAIQNFDTITKGE